MGNKPDTLMSKEEIEYVVEAVRSGLKVGMDDILISKMTKLTEQEILLIKEALKKSSRII